MALITTPFKFETTADEVIAGIDLQGQRAIVTGGASGIGLETASSLARAGAEVTLAVRDFEAGQRVAREIAEASGTKSGSKVGRKTVRAAHLDLADRASIAAFVAAWSGPLHLLINNAGIMACPLARTAEGWEMQFATNHLGHFALSLGLHRALAAGARDAGGAKKSARIVCVSSIGHHVSPVVFDDLHFQQRAYEPWAAYGQSKTANVLFAVEATRRWAADGIFANALMPGGIMTRLQRHVPQATKDGWARRQAAGEFTMKTPQQGAATTLVAAVAPEFEGIGGRYLEDCNEAATLANDVRASAGVRAWALDPDAAAALWARSLEMTGLPLSSSA